MISVIRRRRTIEVGIKIAILIKKRKREGSSDSNNSSNRSNNKYCNYNRNKKGYNESTNLFSCDSHMHGVVIVKDDGDHWSLSI